MTYNPELAQAAVVLTLAFLLYVPFILTLIYWKLSAQVDHHEQAKFRRQFPLTSSDKPR